MRTFVPPFIVEEVRRGVFGGTVRGAVIVIDFPGFTSLAESFMGKGAGGAEELSSILDGLLRPAVDGIISSGGLVGGFAGDSVTGVLPGITLGEARSVAASIVQGERRGSEGSAFRAKAGVCEGPVEWSVIRGRRRLFHYVSGVAVAQASAAQEACRPGEVVAFDPAAPEARDGIRPEPPPGAPVPCCTESFFVPDRVASLETPGEFRFVTSVFVSGPDRRSGAHDRGFLASVLDLAEQYGGYLSGVDTKPEGSNALVLFGAPVSHENDAYRTDRFIVDLIGAFPGARAGVERGLVFTGLLGSTGHSAYTALGCSVNLAARLLYLAEPGTVLSGPSFPESSGLLRSGSVRLRVKGFQSEIEAAVLSAGIVSDRGSLFAGPFVGRDEELSLLENELSASIRNGARRVSIRGEAGVGKSRLVYEFETAHPEIRFIDLQADTIQGRSFNPFVRLLRRFAQLSDQGDTESNRSGFEARVSDLALRRGDKLRRHRPDETPEAFAKRSIPPLGSLLGLSWPGSIFDKLDPKLRFENIITSIRGFLTLLAGGGPTVILLEDSHCLDEDSRKAVDLSMDDLASDPVLWIELGRPGTGSEPAEAPGIPSRGIELVSLDSAAAEALIRSELEGEPSRELTEFILGQTGGNPFFVEQYCRFLSRRRLSEGSDGRLEPPSFIDGLPSGLGSVLIARIDSLPSGVRSAVHAAAVLGREFETAVLSGMLKREDIGPILAVGVEERIWQPVNEREFVFRHALLRDAAYSMQLGSRLKSLHALAAGTTAAIHPEDPACHDVLAYHYERAGMIPEALRHLKPAAAQAARSYLNSQAIDLYARLAALSPEGRGKAEAVFDRAEVERTSGAWSEALAHFREAASLFGSLGLHGRAAGALQRTGRILLDIGEDAAGLEALDNAETLLDLEEDYSIRSQILMVRASYMLRSTDRSGVEEVLERGLQCAMLSGDEEQYLRVRGGMGNYDLEIDNLSSAISHYEAVMEGADRLGNLSLKALSLGNLALACAYMGDDKRARALFRQQLEMAEETGDRYLSVLALGNLGSALSRSWSWREAPVFLRRAVRTARELGAVQHEAIARSNLSEHCIRTGEAAEALENSEAVVRLCREKGIDYYLARCLLVYARSLLLAGRPEEALAALDEAGAVDTSEDHDEIAGLARAEALMQTGRSGEAVEILRRIAESSELELEVEARWLLWRITSGEDDRERALLCNRKWLEVGRYPWVTASRIEAMGGESPSPPPAAGTDNPDSTGI